MSEEERLAWLKANRPQDDTSKQQKAKWGYLQKYWHKGAFFQDEAGGGPGVFAFNGIGSHSVGWMGVVRVGVSALRYYREACIALSPLS
jgi:hypothetical protein